MAEASLSSSVSSSLNSQASLCRGMAALAPAHEAKPETIGSRSTGKAWADMADTPQDSQESSQGHAETTSNHSSAADPVWRGPTADHRPPATAQAAEGLGKERLQDLRYES